MISSPFPGTQSVFPYIYIVFFFSFCLSIKLMYGPHIDPVEYIYKHFLFLLLL